MTDRSAVQCSVSIAVCNVHVYVLTIHETTDDLHVARQRRLDQQLCQHFSRTLIAFVVDTRMRSVCERADAVVSGHHGVDRERDEGLWRAMSQHVPLRPHTRPRVIPRQLTVLRQQRQPGHCNPGGSSLRPSVDHHVRWLSSVNDNNLGSQIQWRTAWQFWRQNQPNSHNHKQPQFTLKKLLAVFS